MRLLWTPRALERVAEIAEIIAREHPRAAEAWVGEVFTTVERLERFPESGRLVPEVHRREIREVIHGDYRIIYHLDAERVAVLTVRHSRQLTGPEDL